MNDIKRSNQRFAMKEAHRLASEIHQLGESYRVTFSAALKIVQLQMNKKLPKTKKAYGSTPITASQKFQIAEMRKILGSEWDGTRGSRINRISKMQADIEIQRNMERYLAQKDLGFCEVPEYQKLIMIKQAFCKLKNIPYTMKDRREISQKDALAYIAKFSKYLKLAV